MIKWNAKWQHPKLKLPALNLASSVIGCLLVVQWIQAVGNFDGNSSPIEMHSRHYTSLVQAGQISNLTAAFPFQTLNAVNLTICQLEKNLSEKTFNFSDSSLTALSPFLQEWPAMERRREQWRSFERVSSPSFPRLSPPSALPCCSTGTSAILSRALL